MGRSCAHSSGECPQEELVHLLVKLNGHKISLSYVTVFFCINLLIEL